MNERPRSTTETLRDRKLQWFTWAIFLLMWGGTFLVERFMAVDLRSLQYVAAGLILLGLNAARYLGAIPMSRLTLIIGFLALFGGLVRQFTGELTIIPIVLITAGSLLLAQGIMTLSSRK